MTASTLALAIPAWILWTKIMRADKKTWSAPGFMLAAGATLSLLYRAFGGPVAPSETVAAIAGAGFAALAFVSACQFRLSRLARQCPAAFRLAFGGAPIFLCACALGAYFFLPPLSLGSALLLGGVLALNGAAFDRRAVMRTSAPAELKSAVRFESAVILTLCTPLAFILTALASAPAGTAPLGPLHLESLALLKGFAIGGAAGLSAAAWGRRRARQAHNRRRRAHQGGLILTAAVVAYAIAQAMGANAVMAALGAGLLWGEDTNAPATTRLRLRSAIESTIAPGAYFLFGAVFAPHMLGVDLLTVLFALAAVSIVRAGPRLLALQSPSIKPENRLFLAWFGGAPGAASALFLISLLSVPALADQQVFFQTGSIAIAAGVIAARMSSRPLTDGYLRNRARAARRRALAAAR